MFTWRLDLGHDKDESCASHSVGARGDWGHLGRGSQPRKISSAPPCDKSLASKGQINAGSARDGGYGAGGRVPRPMGEGYLVSSEGVASVNHAGQLSPSGDQCEIGLRDLLNSPCGTTPYLYAQSSIPLRPFRVARGFFGGQENVAMRGFLRCTSRMLIEKHDGTRQYAHS